MRSSRIALTTILRRRSIDAAARRVAEELESRQLLTSITGIQFDVDSPQHAIRVTFDGPINPATVSSSDLVVARVGSDTNVASSLLTASINTSNDVVTFTKSAMYADGDYKARVFAEDILDASGSPLENDATGEFFFVATDATGPQQVRDRKSDIYDYVLAYSHLGQTPATYSNGDLNYDGQINADDYEAITGVELLAPVTGVTGVSAFARLDGTVNVSWVSKSAAATGFRVQRSDNRGRTFTTIATAAPTSGSYIDSTVDLASSAQYIYRVRSIEPADPLTHQVPVSAYVTTALTSLSAVQSNPIQPPSGLAATAAKNSITLNWNDESTAETGVEVWRSVAGGPFLALEKIETPNITTWTDTGLRASTRYDYQVRTLGPTTSALSDPAGALTLSGAPAVIAGNLETSSPQVIVAQFDQPISANGSGIDLSNISVYSLTGGRQLVPGTELTAVNLAGDRVRVQLGGSLRLNSVLQGVLPDGNYEIIVDGDAVKNAAGQTIADDGRPEGIGETFFFAGDFDHDRSVDFDDLLILAQNYGLSNRTFEQGDSDYDGVVGFSDLLLVAQRYQSRYPAPLTGVSELSASTGPIADPNFDPLHTATPSNAAYVDWTAPAASEGAFEGYKVFRSLDGVNFGSAIATLPITQTDYIDRGLLEGERYTYRVRPYRADGSYGTATNKAAVVTTLLSPAEVKVVSKIDGNLIVTWDDRASNESGYNLEVLDNNTAVVQTLSLPADTETAEISGLTLWHSYTIRLSAVTGSAVGRAPDVQATSGLGGSQNQFMLYAQGISPGRIALSWTPDVTTTDTAFRIFRATSESALLTSPTPVANISGARTFIDASVSVGKTYFYRVVAMSLDGTLSSPSPVVAAVAVNQDDDIDNDGVENGVDDDSDNDGIPNADDTDLDNDGILNTSDKDDGDADGDGVMDWFDQDDDNDGLTDANDDDSDNDGVIDSIDADDDDDGVWDTEELLDPDGDNDGLPDNIDSDDDNDGSPDENDTDRDNDGTLNAVDLDVSIDSMGFERDRTVVDFQPMRYSVPAERYADKGIYFTTPEGFTGSTGNLDPALRMAANAFIYAYNPVYAGAVVGVLDVDFDAPVSGVRFRAGGWHLPAGSMALVEGYLNGELVGRANLVGDGRQNSNDRYMAVDLSSLGFVDRIRVVPHSQLTTVNGAFLFYDDFSFIPLKPDLGLEGVREADEETKGDSLPVNSDDDDSDGVMDGEQSGSVSNEDDLIPMTLELPQEIEEGQLRLSIASGAEAIKVWTDPTRSGTPILAGADTTETWDVHSQPPTVYVEATDAVEAKFVLAYKKPDAATFPTTGPATDTVKMSAAKTVFIDAAGNETTKLKVAKWQNAFDAGAVKNSFIDLDPDRFKVRVTDPGRKGAATIKVKLSTDSDGTVYDDDATVITLLETGADTGIFESKTQMLTSDDVDDDYVVDGIADDAADDRSHIVALGGAIKAEYVLASGETTATSAAILMRKHLKLNVNILKLDGNPVITTEDVQRDIAVMRERYAQIGVVIDATINAAVDAPDGVNLADAGIPGFGVDPTILQPELVALLSAGGMRSEAMDDLEVYYVNFVNTVVGGMVVRDARFPNSIIMSARDKTLFTLGHEAFHLLTTGDHYNGIDSNNNLMRGGADGTSTTNEVTGSKRLSADQEGVADANELLK